MIETTSDTNMLRAIFEPAVPVFESFTITGAMNNTTAMQTAAIRVQLKCDGTR